MNIFTVAFFGHRNRNLKRLYESYCTTSGEGAEWVEVIPGTSPGPLYQPAPSSQGDPAPQGSWRVHHGTSDGSGNKMGQYGIIWFTIIFSGLVLTWGPLYDMIVLPLEERKAHFV